MEVFESKTILFIRPKFNLGPRRMARNPRVENHPNISRAHLEIDIFPLQTSPRRGCSHNHITHYSPVSTWRPKLENQLPFGNQ